MGRVIQLYHSDKYFADIGQHVMPIRKFGLVRRAIEETGIRVRIDEPERVTDEDLLRVHSPEYLKAMETGLPLELAQSQKFPWSPQLAEAVRWTNGGCIATIKAALRDGVAGNLASGFHHAHAKRGEGYCTYNGLVVAMERARAEGLIKRALVIDMDLHYGNGTAFLLETRPDFYAVSIYGNWYDNNKAYRDVTYKVTPNTHNSRSVPVANGSDGDTYLKILDSCLEPAIAWARPDVILYQAGADPLGEDPYSPLPLTHADLRERDLRVFQAAKTRGIPIMWVLAGGYTPDVSRVVAVHVNTFHAAMEVFGDS